MRNDIGKRLLWGEPAGTGKFGENRFQRLMGKCQLLIF